MAARHASSARPSKALAGAPREHLASELERLRARRGTRVLFVYMPGCHACHGTAKHVRAYAHAHPEVRVVAIDATTLDWKRIGEEPEGFPIFKRQRPGEIEHVRLGAFDSLAEMSEWVDKGNE